MVGEIVVLPEVVGGTTGPRHVASLPQVSVRRTSKREVRETSRVERSARERPGVGERLAGLALACHAGPTLTVTAVVTALAAAAGQRPPRLLWLAAAVLAGQLTVGWCNDARDADRDHAAGRTEKPTVRGWVTAPQLARAAVVSGLLCVPLSYLGAGPVGGSAHLVAVGSALAYDLWLKTTVLSVLPWVVSFGLVPVVVTYGLDPARPAAAWLVAVCASLGVAAHLANAVRDLESDRRVGATGLVGRLGSTASRSVALAAVVLATVVLVVALRPAPVVTTVALVVVAVAATAALRDEGRRLFQVVEAVALLDVAVLIVAAAAITA